MGPFELVPPPPPNLSKLAPPLVCLWVYVSVRLFVYVSITYSITCVSILFLLFCLILAWTATTRRWNIVINEREIWNRFEKSSKVRLFKTLLVIKTKIWLLISLTTRTYHYIWNSFYLFIITNQRQLFSSFLCSFFKLVLHRWPKLKQRLIEINFWRM